MTPADPAAAVVALADPARPWLVVGKGPTAGRAVPLAGTHRVLTLNHAARLVRPAVAFVVDIEPVADLADTLGPLLAGPDPPWVVLPWRPHVGFRPTALTLADLPPAHPAAGIVATALAAGRLAAYNSTTASRWPAHPGLRTLYVSVSSAVGAVSLLAAGGVRAARTAGLDGGSGYHPAFDPRDRLANGRSSFDDQRPALVRACAMGGLTLTPVGPADAA